VLTAVRNGRSRPRRSQSHRRRAEAAARAPRAGRSAL